MLTGSRDDSSGPDLSVNPLHLQQNVSFYNRSFSSFLDYHSMATLVVNCPDPDLNLIT